MEKKKNIIQKLVNILVTKLYFVTRLYAKFNFARKYVPKFNLGSSIKLEKIIMTELQRSIMKNNLKFITSNLSFTQ